ncbi:DsbA family protein [Sedimentitalea arenosa]|uniref:DsbA family protein n=1 Tax=Sedimentitalea arenosa TaxID=2798803 RepID=A0A8J7IKX0_9RHOB|nr:DsbA family protein [Arenibacterium arenosum]MBJ6372093.1 DsbA family protein [Arenibacterium arenosum]
MKRRDVLILAGLAAVVVALPRARRLGEPEFEFETIPGLAGFRRLSGGSVSSLPIALVGIDTLSAEQNALRRAIASSPCDSLWHDGGAPAPGIVPVAVFTDYNCPYCPTLSETVIALQEAGEPIAVRWQDLPLLGPRSEDAARAALAAERQDAYLPLHRHLMRSTLRPGEAQLGTLAESFGLEPSQFVEDAASEEVAARIERSRALADVFGIVGTPSLVVGRTLVVGTIEERDLRRLIALEAAMPPGPCFAG